MPVALLMLANVVASAADPKPIVGPGATRDQVLDAYGWPTGQSKSGTKEILSYPQGRVTLENGRVEKVDFLMNVPWPPPRPRPGAPSATSKKVEAPIDYWMTDFDLAAAEATRRNARILALFTGSDWSPASKLFHDEVEFHPEFVHAFTGDYVFLRIDFPIRGPQSPELRDRNARLRAQYAVTMYPTLLVLAPSGAVLGRVDLEKPQPGETYRARVIAAVREIRDLLKVQAPLPPPPEPVVAAAPTPPAGVVASLKSARTLIGWSLLLGVAVIALLSWLVWRPKRYAPHGRATSKAMSARISDAASGLPTSAEMMGWPRPKLRGLVSGLAAAEGYVVEPQAEGSDKDLVLRRGGETKPCVLIWIAPEPGAAMPLKRVREYYGTLTIDDVPLGWVVSPGGFAPDARKFAEEHNLVPIDSEHLIAQLRNLPPLMLPKVLMRAG